MKIAVLCGGRSSERDVSLSTGIQVARALRETGHDVVLVDAPCSGMGGGTKPDAYLNRTENNVCELASLQQKILEACCRCVKPGGRLVYSTCTLEQAENNLLVSEFLNANTEFDYAGFRHPLTGETINELQLLPQCDNVDGFYICVMRRKEL